MRSTRRRFPPKPAWDTAIVLVDDFLKNHPVKKVGMDLNADDTMRDFGVMEAQILYLMGVAAGVGPE